MPQTTLTVTFPRVRRASRLLSIVGILVAVGCGATPLEAEGDLYMRQARFADAYDSYKRAQAKGPASEQLQVKLREAYLATELQKAQTDLFAGRLVVANTTLRALAAQMPDNPAVMAWLKKSERDLSRLLSDHGKENLALRNYDAAIRALKKAIDLDPSNDDAADALERAATILEWRAEKGDSLWRDGLKAMAEGNPLQAEAQIRSSLQYTPDRPGAQDVLGDLKLTVAELRQRLASNLEAKGQISAAERQYKIAKSLGLSGEEIQIALDRTSKEVKADEKVRAAEIALTRNDFEKAAGFLKEARDLTIHPENRTAIDARLFQVQERANDADFKQALVAEFEGKFDIALERLRALDERSPGYRDTRERMDRISKQLKDATTAYEEGNKLFEVGELDKARAKFRAAIFLHPLFLDAREKLKEVDAAIRARDRKTDLPSEEVPPLLESKPAGEPASAPPQPPR